MNIEFTTNDYLLAWYLLFKPSFCEQMQSLKIKLYKNYPKQYMALEKENIEILKYNNDFIPDDDTIYNIIFESEIFQKIKKEADKHRIFLMKLWDTNQKKIRTLFKEITRISIKEDFCIIVIHPKLDTIEFIDTNPKKNISWGKKDDVDNDIQTLMRLLYTITKYKVGSFHKENREIVSAIIDLVITNELQTRLVNSSKYNEGFKSLRTLKKQIYPYFLMYLGAIEKEELVSYMMRDKIAFDIDKIRIEKELKEIDLYGFIDFCCKNQKYILKKL